ncbi:MAG: hypothetical protein ACK41Y_16485, partial [Paracoccus hibiscisoli]|uniref:hypothetical protein n=1 Tax=Paracoccus hibiscisoli TaxID=2023261 RepID=UPI0039192DCC
MLLVVSAFWPERAQPCQMCAMLARSGRAVLHVHSWHDARDVVAGSLQAVVSGASLCQQPARRGSERRRRELDEQAQHDAAELEAV